MRILLISGRYPPEMCGVGDYTVHLAQALAQADRHDVGLFTRHDLDMPHPAISQVRFEGGWVWWKLPTMLRALRGWKPELVHLQYPSLGYPRSLAPILLSIGMRLLRVRLVVTLHEPMRWLSLPWFLSFCLASQAVILVRHNYFELIPRFHASLLRRKPHRLILNASPLPTSALGEEQKFAFRRELAQGKTRLLVYFGFIFPQKGIETLLDIINPQTDRLLLIGANPDAGYQAQLQRLIDQKGLAATVSMTGMLAADQVADRIACCDAVVLPLPKGAGSWNTTVHASLAQGTAVITTTTGQAQELPDQNLYYARVNDKEEMKRLLNLYAGKKIPPVSPDREWVKIANDHLQVYQQALSV